MKDKKEAAFHRGMVRGQKSIFNRFYHKAINGQLSQITKIAIYVTSILVLVLIGNLFQDASFGVAAVIIYGFGALLLRIRSEETFKMALIMLLYILFLSLLKNQILAENFAQYAFILLLFGMVSAFCEQWRDSHKKI